MIKSIGCIPLNNLIIYRYILIDTSVKLLPHDIHFSFYPFGSGFDWLRYLLTPF